MAEGKAYFCSFWNLIDVLGLLMVVYVLISTGLGLGFTPPSALRVIAAFGSCFTLIKLFDWLRLFEDTAFYVLLVGETLYDIRYFLLLLLITLMMFGVPLLMLDANSLEDKELIEASFGFWLADLLYN